MNGIRVSGGWLVAVGGCSVVTAGWSLQLAPVPYNIGDKAVKT